MESTALSIRGYTIGRSLGAGAHGAVWAAVHQQTGLPVAIKVCRDATPERHAVFAREIRFLQGLQHPGVVRVLDRGWAPARGATVPYAVLPLYVGGTLADHLGVLSWDAQLNVLRELLEALAYVHAHRIVHRDLKPSNVLVSPGPRHPCLADFGIAVFAEDGADHAGTPAYASPEQLVGRPCTRASDLYSLGCVAYALCTGGPPFAGVGRLGMIQAHARRPPPPLRRKMPVPAGLDGWILSLLAKDPRDRFPSARWAQAALDALGPAVVAPPTPGVRSPAADETLRTLPVGSPDVPPTPPIALAETPRETLLIGREAEVGEIVARVGTASLDHGPCIVMVTGAPGSGRRTVVRAAARQADERGVARVLWSSSDTAVAALLLAQQLAVDPGSPQRVRAWRAALPVGAAVASVHLATIDDATDRDLTAIALREVIVGLATTERIVLIVDEIDAPKAPWWSTFDTSIHLVIVTSATVEAWHVVRLGALGSDLLRRILEEHGTAPDRIPGAVARAAGSPGRALAVARCVDASVESPLDLGLDLDGIRAAERVALLHSGTHVRVWRAACADLGAEAMDAAEIALARHGVASDAGGVWRFDDASAMRQIGDRARALGRAPDHHRALAEAMPDEPAWRKARQWLDAGLAERAANVLVSTEPQWTLHAFEVTAQCVTEVADRHPQHPAIGELLRHLAHFATTYGDPSAGEALVAEAERRFPGDDGLRGRVAVWRSMDAFRRGDMAASARQARSAYEYGLVSGDVALRVRGALREGMARSHGEGTTALDAAVARARAASDGDLPPELAVFVAVLEGASAQARDHLDSARAVFNDALRIAVAADRPDLVGQIGHYVLDVALDQDDRRASHEAIDLIRTALGEHALNRRHVALRVALLAVRGGDPVSAREALRPVIKPDDREADALHALLAAISGLEGDLPGAQASLDWLEEVLAATPTRGMHTLRCLAAIEAPPDAVVRAHTLGAKLAREQDLAAWVAKFTKAS